MYSCYPPYKLDPLCSEARIAALRKTIHKYDTLEIACDGSEESKQSTIRIKHSMQATRAEMAFLLNQVEKLQAIYCLQKWCRHTLRKKHGALTRVVLRALSWNTTMSGFV